MITLELPTAPPSGNVYQRMHHWARTDLKIRHVVELGWALDSAGVRTTLRPFVRGAGRKARTIPALGLRERAVGHRAVRIVRRGPRALDRDRLVGGCVALVDALRFVGLIENDTETLVTVTYDQERGTGCRVEVWAAQDDREVA